jgi:hypothetical protein
MTGTFATSIESVLGQAHLGYPTSKSVHVDRGLTLLIGKDIKENRTDQKSNKRKPPSDPYHDQMAWSRAPLLDFPFGERLNFLPRLVIGLAKRRQRVDGKIAIRKRRHKLRRLPEAF